MDGNLNWKSEITHVANKGSKSIGIIRKSIFYLSTKSLRTLYFSLVYRYFFFTAILFGPLLTELTVIRLKILQKKVIRTTAKTP